MYPEDTYLEHTLIYHLCMVGVRSNAGASPSAWSIRAILGMACCWATKDGTGTTSTDSRGRCGMTPVSSLRVLSVGDMIIKPDSVWFWPVETRGSNEQSHFGSAPSGLSHPDVFKQITLRIMELTSFPMFSPRRRHLHSMPFRIKEFILVHLYWNDWNVWALQPQSSPSPRGSCTGVPFWHRFDCNGNTETEKQKIVFHRRDLACWYLYLRCGQRQIILGLCRLIAHMPSWRTQMPWLKMPCQK